MSKKQALESLSSKFVGKHMLLKASAIYHITKISPKAKRTNFFNIIVLSSIKTANLQFWFMIANALRKVAISFKVTPTRQVKMVKSQIIAVNSLQPIMKHTTFILVTGTDLPTMLRMQRRRRSQRIQKSFLPIRPT